jgi:BirA family transcriptional regulator, biotin operon repressor / biotin---[acetyl-CoA-carboxylase] ligase
MQTDTPNLRNHILEVAECASTNAMALQLLADGQAPTGLVVWAHAQTAGRGQQGTTWRSQSGNNLTCSAVLRPTNLRADEAFRLGQAVALAVHTVVAGLVELGPPTVCIKWPNDVLVRERKVAGILIETQVQGANVSAAVVGIGLNVNQLEFSGDYARSPTSLQLECRNQPTFAVSTVLHQVLCNLEAQVWRLYSGQNDRIAHDYTQALWRLNLPVHYRTNGTEHTGTLHGADHRGRLVLQHTDTSTHVFDPKTIEFLD